MWFKFIKQAGVEDKIGKFLEKLDFTKTKTETEWFEEGEEAYLNPDLESFDFTGNITTGETDKEAEKLITDLTGKKVTVKNIEQREGLRRFTKPEEVIVVLDNGSEMRWPTAWLSHKSIEEK